MARSKDGQMDGRMDMAGWTARRMKGWMDGQTDGRVDRDGLMDGQMKG